MILLSKGRTNSINGWVFRVAIIGLILGTNSTPFLALVVLSLSDIFPKELQCESCQGHSLITVEYSPMHSSSSLSR